MVAALAKMQGQLIGKSVATLANRVTSDESYLANFQKIILNDTIKETVNYIVNGSAVAFSTFTFLNGNLNIFSNLHKYFEPISETLTRFGTVVSGFTGAIDTYKKKNLLSFLGYSAMVPIGLLTKGYNQWLARGISSGLTNFVLINDRREKVDESGEPITGSDGNIQYMSGVFPNMMDSLKTTCSEGIKMIKECFQKPARIIRFSHATLITSLFQMVGSIPAWLGFDKAGAFIRNASGISSFVAMLQDTSSNSKQSLKSKSIINFKSPIVQCSLLRIGTSLFDLFKRFDFFSSRVSNSTDISLGMDRLASLLYSRGVFNIKKRSN